MEPNNNPAPSEAPKSTASPAAAQPTSTPDPLPTQPSTADSSLDTKSNKSSKPIIWCLAILATIGIVAAAIFAYLYFTTPTTPPETSTPSGNQDSATPTTTETTEETEVTDTYILRDLDNKIAILHDTTQTDTTIDKGRVVWGYSNDIFDMYATGYLNPLAARVSYVINALKSQFRILSIEERNSVAENVPPEYREEVEKKALEGIDGDIVAKQYKDVFGVELSRETSEGCYTYRYDSAHDFYYSDPIGGCGGTSPYKTFHYKNKYTSNGKNAYVYVYVALSDAAENKVYCDLSYLDFSGTSSISEDAKVCAALPENENFTLDQSNFQGFAQYRFVFNKADDGTYYFSKVEKL